MVIKVQFPTISKPISSHPSIHIRTQVSNWPLSGILAPLNSSLSTAFSPFRCPPVQLLSSSTWCWMCWGSGLRRTTLASGTWASPGTSGAPPCRAAAPGSPRRRAGRCTSWSWPWCYKISTVCYILKTKHQVKSQNKPSLTQNIHDHPVEAKW